MRHEDPRVHLSRQWLSRAVQDLRVADLLVNQGSLHEPVAFHCQQAVEKALKAFLAWRDVPFRKTHDLSELVFQCAAVDADFHGLSAHVAPLSRYAFTGRYPFAGDVIDLTAASGAVAVAREAVQFVLDHLPPEVRP